MANSNTIIEEIKKFPIHQQEHIYSFLEGVLVLGSQVSRITQEVKEFRFDRGRSVLIAVLILYQEMENITVNNDIYVSHVQRLLLTLLTLLLTKAKNIRYVAQICKVYDKWLFHKKEC